MDRDQVAIGIDVGGTNLRAALVGADGVIRARLAGPVERDRGAFVAALAARAMELGGERAVAIGVGLPGRVDVARDAVVSAGYLDIAGLNVPAMLRAATGLPVCIENDCTMALIAEMAVGAATDHRDVAMLTIGTGIGGAIALDRRLVRGGAFAGQLGHMSVDPDGEICNCGRRGCIETTSSGTALTRLLRRGGGSPAMTPAGVLAAAHDGDPAAIALLRAWLTPLRSAIESLVAVIDPGIVLLGGGLGLVAQRGLDLLAAECSWFERPVRPASLGDDAGVIGAADLARNFVGQGQTAE
jgi:glucokinase